MPPLASSSPARRTIAIIGGGFAGTVAAVKLIEATRDPLDLIVIDPAAELGRGIAYATPAEWHFVNGPAANFTLYPDQPDHLWQWTVRNPAYRDWRLPAEATPDTLFLPRHHYGRYVQDVLEAAHAAAGGRVHFTHRRASAIDIVPDDKDGGLTVIFDAAPSLRADQVVLATGLVPKPPSFPIAKGTADPDSLITTDLWRAGAFADAARLKQVAIIGSSLTALDILVGLERSGFTGIYTLLSRHGLIAQERRALPPWPDFLAGQPLPTTALGLLRLVNRERHAIAAAGEDWQRLPPSIRPHIIALWAGASTAERQRFVRHLRAFWEISLHRSPPDSFALLERVRSARRLTTIAGRIDHLHRSGEDKPVIVYRPRGASETRRIEADALFGAHGNEFDWQRIDRPLERKLLQRGLVRPHPTGYGIDGLPATGQVIGSNGLISDRLFAIGHPFRGASWESSSIGEQLAHAIALARALAATDAARSGDKYGRIADPTRRKSLLIELSE